MLQSLPKSLLSFRRQTAECGIALECVLLFGRRQVFIAPKPVAGMATWLLTPLRLPVGRLVLRRRRRSRVSLRRRRRCLGRMSLLRRMEGTGERQTRHRNSERDHQTGGRQPIHPVFSLPHFPALHFAVGQLIP